MLNTTDQSILITGATGTFGRGFVKFLLKNYYYRRIIVFSRDEYKQLQMQQEIDDPRLRFFLGDVRDLDRLKRAFDGVDVIIHAAALKQVPALEYNPSEAVKTNIMGTQNVIDAAIDQGVQRVIFISSDKAAAPGNLYGATKLCAEKLIVASNSYAYKKCRLCALRYGNMIISRGSVTEMVIKNKKARELTITEPAMTRFWITNQQIYDLVIFALENMEGGEIFIPKIPSMKLVDVFEALAPKTKKTISGIRPGEKLHEVLFTEEEARHTVDIGHYFVLLPEYEFTQRNFQKYYTWGQNSNGNTSYTSDKNTLWLKKSQLKRLVDENSCRENFPRRSSS